MVPSSVIVWLARLVSVLGFFLGLPYCVWVDLCLVCDLLYSFLCLSVFIFFYRCSRFFFAFKYSCRVSSFLLGLSSLVAFWKAAFFIFWFFFATLISSLFGLGSLSILIFFFPIVFTTVSRISLSYSGYSIFLSSSLLRFISLLNLSHPSSLARFHFSIYVFFLGRLVVIVVMMVLWSVSFFPLTLNCPSSSTIVADGFAIPLDVTM